MVSVCYKVYEKLAFQEESFRATVCVNFSLKGMPLKIQVCVRGTENLLVGQQQKYFFCQPKGKIHKVYGLLKISKFIPRNIWRSLAQMVWGPFIHQWSDDSEEFCGGQ